MYLCSGVGDLRRLVVRARERRAAGGRSAMMRRKSSGGSVRMEAGIVVTSNLKGCLVGRGRSCCGC